MTTPEPQTAISSETGDVLDGKAATSRHDKELLTARMPLRTKLIAAFLAVTLIPLALLSYVNDRATRQALTDAANVKLKGAAEQTADSIDSFIRTNLSTIQTEARLPELINYLNLAPEQRRNSPEEVQALVLLQILSAKNPNISSYALLDTRGLDVLDTYTPDIDLNMFTSDYFQKPLDTLEPYASPIRFSATTGELVLYFSSPVENNGEVIGVLFTRYNAGELQQIIAQRTGQVGEGSFAILLDEDHIRLADGAQPQMAFKSVVPLTPERLAELKADGRLPDLPPEDLATNLPDFEQALSTAQPSFATELHTSGESLNQSAVAQTTQQPWVVVFAQPQEEFLAPLAEQTRNALIAVLGLVVVVIAVAVVMAQLLTGPIAQLTSVAGQVTAGNLAVQAQVHTRDEIGVLAAAFNSMTDQLRNLIGSLETRVAERTAQLRASTEVGQAAASTLDQNQLLQQVVNLITDHFGFYYAAVFTLNETNTAAILREASGEAGRILKERAHQLAVNEHSMVGYAIIHRRPRIALDVGADPVRFANPLLPETHSEIALPLITGNRVLGALDVQSTQAAAFDEASAVVLQGMANQIAVALHNAEQFKQAERQATLQSNLNQFSRSLFAATTAEELYQVLAETLPNIVPHDYLSLTFASTGSATLREYPLSANTQPVLSEGPVWSIANTLSGHAYTMRQPVLSTRQPQEAKLNDVAHLEQAGFYAVLSLPLIVGERVLGTLNFASQEAGTFSALDSTQLEQLASQVAVALENQRLVQAQQTSLREMEVLTRQLTGQAWAKRHQRQTVESVQYARSGIDQELAAPAPEIEAAIEQRAPIARTEPDTTGQASLYQSSLAVPIMLRGEVLGGLQVGETQETRVWSEDDLTFVQAVADQVALALDNARLLEETERRAQRERLVAEISSKMFAQNDLESIVEIAATEIGQALHLSRTEIQLRTGAGAALGETTQVPRV